MGKRYLRRRLLSFSLALCMVLTLFPVRTRAGVYEGDCGAVNASDVHWAFDDETGVLTITGSGPMADYYSEYNTPWTDYHNYAITSVKIGEGVTRVGHYAFQYCYNLTDVSFPLSLTSVGDCAFQYCNSLASVTLPEALESIGSQAFSCCTALTSVTIPASVKSLGEYAFSYCTALSTVSLVEGLESIGSCAFQDCYVLSSLTIPKSVTEIGDNAFPGSLTPDVYMDTYAWRYCVSNNIAYNVINGDGKSYVSAGECGENVYWKLDADGLLTVHGSGAMSDFDRYNSGSWRDYCDSIQSVDIQSGVTSVGADAFYSYNHTYSNLTAVSLPDTLISIGEQAFYNCDALTSVTIPATVTEISGGAFGACDNLVLTVEENSPGYAYAMRANIPFKISGGDTYHYDASGECGTGVYWTLDGDTLTVFGSGAMRNFVMGETPWYNFREEIKSVSVDAGVTNVSSYAFSYCDALESVTIPDSVTSIGDCAFYDCDALKSVTIPDSVTQIGDSAFGDCPNLILTVTKDTPAHDYALSSHIRYRLVGSDTVYVDWGDCGEKDENGNMGNNAQWVLTDDGLLKISGSGAMYDCEEWYVPWLNLRDSLRSVEIDSGITRIGSYSFYNCNHLTSVSVPDSVTSIGAYAFSGCTALFELTLPASVDEIEDHAFESCDNLVVTAPDNSATRQAISAEGIPHKLPGSEIVYRAFGLWGAQASQSWALEANGILTVSGSGAIADYENSGLVKWASVRDSIRAVVVENGVTKIGSYAFADCGNLEKAFLAASVKTLGERAFANDSNLTFVSLEEGLNTVSASVFENAVRLTALTVPESVNSIGADAFRTDYSNSLTLTVYGGSTAETYAEASDIPHTTLTRGTAKVSGVELNESSLLVTPGQVAYLTASVRPQDAGNKTVTWSSSNPGAVSVDARGIVTALAEGEAEITATTADGGKTASCAVTVLSQIPVSAIVLSVSRKALKVGGEFELTATVFPENASDKTVTWSTSDEKIASVSENYYGPNTANVRKEDSGTAVITARSADGSVAAECEIVEHLAVTGVRIDKKSIILKQGGEDTLSATVLPEGATNDTVTWHSTNGDIAEVTEDGRVKAGSNKGKATLVATTEENGFTAFCLVEVTADVTNVEGIALDCDSIPALGLGASRQLVATFTPPNATNQAVTWTSTAPEVVAVSDNGVVTALERGKTAVITAMTADGGHAASCVVTVSDLTSPAELIVHLPSGLEAVEAVQGSPLNLAGVWVEALYGDISEEVSDYSVYDYDRDRVGAQSVRVSYQGASASLAVTVVARHAERVFIAQSPAKREYAIGEALDLSGLILQAEYNDQTLETIKETSEMAAVGFRSDVAGTYPVTVIWNGLSVAFYVTVLAESDEPVVLSAPKMNISGYPGGKRVELSAVSGAEIRYELGDRTPSFDSALYQEPILCTESTAIRAVAFLNGEYSAVTASRVFVDRVEPPAASHDDGAQLPAGTLVTLRTPTDGATIRYTTDGSDPTAESPLYSSGVLVSADMTLKAVAVMSGARNSEIFTASYTAEKRTDAQSAATISIGSVTSRAGERVSIPVYLFTDENQRVTFFRFTVSFDGRAFEYASIAPAEGIAASNLMVSSGVNGGSVTVMYDGSAMESGEAFTLTLRARDSSEDGEYRMLLSAEDGITIRTAGERPLVVNPTPGVITLSGSHNSQLTGEISLQDEDGNPIEALRDGQDQINVSFALNPYTPDVSQSNGAPTAMADVYLALYDDEGLMLDLQHWNIELKNVWLSFSQVKQVPPAIKGRIDKIKIMILSEDMTPVMAASEL